MFLRTYYWGVPSRSERGVAGLRAARRGSSKICRSTRPLRPSGLSSRSIEAANVLFLVLALPRKPKSSPNAKVVSAAAPIRRRGFKLVAPPSAHLLFGTTRPALLSDGSRRQRQFSRLESRCALGCQRDIGSGSSSNDKVARDRAGLCLGKCCFVSVKDFPCSSSVVGRTANMVTPSFAAPSDCYNIALASKRFFQPVSCSDAPEQRSDQKPRRKSKRLKSAGGPAGVAPPLLLATRMLRVSLEHSLVRVLEHSRSGITLVSRFDPNPFLF